MTSLPYSGKTLTPLFKTNDILLILSVILICIAPAISSFCIVCAFILNIFRMFKYDIHTFMFDIMTLMPFANIYKLAPKTPSLVLILILLGLLWFTIKKIKSANIYTPVVFIAVIYLTIRSGFLIDALLSIICSLALVCLFARNAEDKDVIKVAYGYIVSVAFSVIVAYLTQGTNLYIDYISDDIQVSQFSDAVRFKGLFSDPNYLGTYLLSGISILFQLLIMRKIRITYFMGLLFILTFGGLLSYSKGFFLTFIAIMILSIYNLWKSGNKKSAFIFLTLLGIASIYAIRGAFSDVNIILDRFRQDSNIDDLTTGRTSLWAKYAQNIFSNLHTFLIGHGLDSPLLIQGAHNLYLESFYYIGGVGLFLIIASYISSFKSSIERFKHYNISYKGIAALTLVVLLAIYWSLQGLFGFATYFQFFIAILMFRLPSLKKE